MSTIRVHRTTTSTPEQFLAGLTTSARPSTPFGDSAHEYLKVSPWSLDADVTEGSTGIWGRLDYDLSDPTHVVMETTDSNLWGGNWATPIRWRSGPMARPTSTLRRSRREDLEGRALGFVLGPVGKGVLDTASEHRKGHRGSERRRLSTARVPRFSRRSNSARRRNIECCITLISTSSMRHP